MSDTAAQQLAELQARVAQLTEQCDAARRELESFTYAVSHDLRAPLRSLSGFSQALAELPDSNLDPKAQHYLARIQQAGHRISDLIDALLGLSRISRADLQLRRLDFTQLCNEAATTVRARYPGHAMQLTIAPEMSVFGDSRMLRTAMELLLDNAFKFTANRTQPQASVEPMVVDGAEVICVRDNGAGFDMAYADKLFRPFQRLHGDAQFAGLGIGLATVQRILSRHAGRVWAQAAPLQGAQFFLALPHGK